LSKSKLLYDWQSLSMSWYRVRVRVTLQLTVSRSVCLGVGHSFGAHDQISLFPLFCLKIDLIFVLGHPLWREDGSVLSLFKSTLQVCPYLKGNTLRLRYDPCRLMLSIGLWRWYVNITITILDIEVEVTLRLTVSQSVCLDMGNQFGAHDHFFFLSFPGQLLCSSSWGALSDERTGLQFVSGQSCGGLITIHHYLIWDCWVPFPSPLITSRDYGGSILVGKLRFTVIIVSCNAGFTWGCINGLTMYHILLSSHMDVQNDINIRGVGLPSSQPYFDSSIYFSTRHASRSFDHLHSEIHNMKI
jgi:hypothetical protein